MNEIKQWERVLYALRQRPLTTVDIYNGLGAWILAPQKCIETLRGKGFIITTEPIKGEKFSKYTLIQEPKEVA